MAAPGSGGGQGAWGFGGPSGRKQAPFPAGFRSPCPDLPTGRWEQASAEWPELEFIFFFKDPIVNVRTFKNEILRKSFSVSEARFESKLPRLLATQLRANSASFFWALFPHL